MTKNIEDFVSLIQFALDNYQTKIASVKQNISHSWDASIQPLEEAAENLDQIWNRLEHLNAVANSAKIRDTYEQLLPIITDFNTGLMQDQELYNVFLAVRKHVDFVSLSIAQQNIVKNEIRDFKLYGVDLPSEQRQQFKLLAQRLSALENEFANNALDATEGWSYHVTPDQENLLAGIPAYAIATASSKAQFQNKDGWVLTLDQACYAAVIPYAHNRELRREFYTAYYTRASAMGPNAGKWDNFNLIVEILNIRRQMAQLVGYANYAEYSLVPKMASNVLQVKNFLLDMATKVKPKAQKEIQELQQFAKQYDNNQQLQAWDVAYYSELYKQQNYNISEEALREYFPEQKVLTGLFKLVRKLFGLEIEEVTDFATWHQSVRMFKVIDREHEIRGHFYIDLYAREGKRGGAWMADCLSRISFANGRLQKPIAYLNCNFLASADQSAGLLTHTDVLTLFHEFGHTLHHVLTQVNYYSASGMNGVEWDAVELPSQFMENWCWEWFVIQDISENINTGEPLPEVEFNKLLATKNFHSGLALARQLEYTLIDLLLHADEAATAGLSVQEIINTVRKNIGVIPIPEFNKFQNTFSHIFAGGYEAGYYSYLWAEVLSCDAFEKFRSAGLFDEQVGRQFLEQILELGGSKPAMDLFVAFAGREPKIDALLRHHVITDV